MKFAAFILFIEIVAAIVALMSSLVGAPNYGMLFAISMAAGLVAVGCVIYLYCSGSRLFLAGLVPGLLALYVICDVVLRRFAGIRVLDLFS
ncbi:MAG: hypothetical protein Q8N31_10520 [Reyranella sp.]|nr:hypothetical protein [Reyranella sp.]MDP3160440.1 hypothetical protein [Reyranella sp.]